MTRLQQIKCLRRLVRQTTMSVGTVSTGVPGFYVMCDSEQVAVSLWS